VRRPYPWLLVLAMAVAAGCGAPAAAPTDAGPAANAQVPAATAVPVDATAGTLPTTGDIAAPATADQAAQAARDPNRDFTPSDPAAVTLAAGTPQLVEFFAHW